MSRILAASIDYAMTLDESRRDLLDAAHKFASAEERQKAQAELMASAQSYITPKPGESVKLEIDEDGTAHIPIVGGLTPAVSPCGSLAGEAETEYGFIQSAVNAAEADPRVARARFDIDSPGGDVHGLDETAQAIASMTKPTESYVGSMAASAAYFLASQTDRIVAASPMSQIGSIGILMRVKEDKGDGVKDWRFVSSGAPKKRPDLSTDEGRAVIQERVDAMHDVFVRRVSEGRGVSEDSVRSDFGQGGILLAEKACEVGMIDAVEGSHFSRKNKPGMAGEKASADSAANKSGGHKVTTLDEFKAANPGALEAYGKEQFDAGTQAERKRRDDLVAFRGINADGDKAVEEAIASGKTFADANPVIQAAILRGKTTDTADGENAPGVETASDKVPESGISAEDAAWAEAHGMTAEEFAKHSRKDGE